MIALNLELVRGLQARLYALIKNIPANHPAICYSHLNSL